MLSKLGCCQIHFGNPGFKVGNVIRISFTRCDRKTIKVFLCSHKMGTEGNFKSRRQSKNCVEQVPLVRVRIFILTVCVLGKEAFIWLGG